VSQAPSGSESKDQQTRYADAWKILLRWTEEGRSFSGHERNCCFLNVPGSERFAAIAGISGLNFPDDSRGIGICDWDFDGKQDLWISARTAPQIRFLRNESPVVLSNHFIKLRLTGRECNRDAIGARVTVTYDDAGEKKQTKSLRAGEGFLSQGSKWLHFGVGNARTVSSVVIRWPNGSEEAFTSPDVELATDQHYALTQGTGIAEQWSPPSGPLAWNPGGPELPIPQASVQHRVASRLPSPALQYKTLKGETKLIQSELRRPILVMLWASWCRPCLEEMRNMGVAPNELKALGVDVLALTVDGVGDKPKTTLDAAIATAERLKFPFKMAQASNELLDAFQSVHDDLFMVRRPLPLPSSILLDADGNLAALYRGPLDVSRLVQDVKDLRLSAQDWFKSSLTRPGRWVFPPTVNPSEIYAEKGRRLAKAGDWETAEQAFRQALEYNEQTSLPYFFLGTIEVRRGGFTLAESYFRRTLELDPEFTLAGINLADLLMRKGKYAAAEELYLQAMDQQPMADAYMKLAILADMRGDDSEAEARFQKAVQLEPRNSIIQANLGKFLLDHGKLREAIEHLLIASNSPDPNLAARINLAWILSTAPDEEIRNPNLAVEIAEKCVQETDRKNPLVLDRLAAAYASAGRYDDAQDVAAEGIRIAKERAETDLVNEIEARLKLYREKKSYRLTQ
jgi:Tfp pilus assembly protein PilF/peroxiredoxin